MPTPAPAPPSAPAGPPAAAGFPDWIRAVSVVDARIPSPASAPNTRQLVLANASDRRIYQVTIAWVGVDTPEPCNVARERFGGQQTLYANLPPGGRTTVFADFPPAARAFCVVDARASSTAPRRAPPAPPAPGAPSPPPDAAAPPEAPQQNRE